MPESRTERLKRAVQSARPGVCPERALIWTRYFKNRAHRKRPVCIQMAEALRNVLLEKSIAIYPDELIVGNFSSRRVGGSIYPELHGVVVMQDLLKFPKRETNPLEISGKDVLRLASIIPFWLFRFLGVRAHSSMAGTLRFVADQLNARCYFINESGGIAHLAPHYERLVNMGTDGIIERVNSLQAGTAPGTDNWNFYEAVRIIAKALAAFGARYAELALEMSEKEGDAVRRRELLDMEAVCRNVPRRGARTFREALQSIFLAQIAINLESLDNAVSPGRMDQYLYPFYERDLAAGMLTREGAKELASAFSIKMSEIVPVFSGLITQVHGGMFNGQVVTVGGVDREGNDGSNELSDIFLEVMDELRMRQPNYHARVHGDAPGAYVEKIYRILSGGANSPALYNDDVIVETLVRKGYHRADARDYTAVGCVEPVCQGKSFSSTDAALFNVPLMLELALNRGRRFSSLRRIGKKTAPVSHMKSMDDVKRAFEIQLEYGLERLIKDLQAIERANARYHPTPLTSMLLEGCLEKGVCSTRGGAAYNFSGIQCVGPADAGDSLYAIERAVFRDKRLGLEELVAVLKNNIQDEKWFAFLNGVEKYGNDCEEADRHTIYVIDTFSRMLEGRRNTRGGEYTTGLYSVTVHDYFGSVTGALPSGRRRGESFASGISPANGRDRLGPTAMLNSVNRVDATRFANGVNLNVKFSAGTLAGNNGTKALRNLMTTYFQRGGMQVQFNIIDPAILMEARENPGAHPGLLVRVSGYSAYFSDLSPKMKDEIIRRTCLAF
jgi:pyruvate formate-lyase/glycerol dehydratase family glycyl radical enzyme